jgi:hypothetical protein
LKKYSSPRSEERGARVVHDRDNHRAGSRVSS